MAGAPPDEESHLDVIWITIWREHRKSSASEIPRHLCLEFWLEGARRVGRSSLTSYLQFVTRSLATACAPTRLFAIAWGAFTIQAREVGLRIDFL